MSDAAGAEKTHSDNFKRGVRIRKKNGAALKDETAEKGRARSPTNMVSPTSDTQRLPSGERDRRAVRNYMQSVTKIRSRDVSSEEDPMPETPTQNEDTTPTASATPPSFMQQVQTRDEKPSKPFKSHLTTQQLHRKKSFIQQSNEVKEASAARRRSVTGSQSPDRDADGNETLAAITKQKPFVGSRLADRRGRRGSHTTSSAEAVTDDGRSKLEQGKEPHRRRSEDDSLYDGRGSPAIQGRADLQRRRRSAEDIEARSARQQAQMNARSQEGGNNPSSEFGAEYVKRLDRMTKTRRGSWTNLGESDVTIASVARALGAEQRVAEIQQDQEASRKLEKMQKAEQKRQGFELAKRSSANSWKRRLSVDTLQQAQSDRRRSSASSVGYRTSPNPSPLSASKQYDGIQAAYSGNEGDLDVSETEDHSVNPEYTEDSPKYGNFMSNRNTPPFPTSMSPDFESGEGSARRPPALYPRDPRKRRSLHTLQDSRFVESPDNSASEEGGQSSYPATPSILSSDNSDEMDPPVQRQRWLASQSMSSSTKSLNRRINDAEELNDGDGLHNKRKAWMSAAQMSTSAKSLTDRSVRHLRPLTAEAQNLESPHNRQSWMNSSTMSKSEVRRRWVTSQAMTDSAKSVDKDLGGAQPKSWAYASHFSGSGKHTLQAPPGASDRASTDEQSAQDAQASILHAFSAASHRPNIKPYSSGHLETHEPPVGLSPDSDEMSYHRGRVPLQDPSFVEHEVRQGGPLARPKLPQTAERRHNTDTRRKSNTSNPNGQESLQDNDTVDDNGHRNKKQPASHSGRRQPLTDPSFVPDIEEPVTRPSTSNSGRRQPLADPDFVADSSYKSAIGSGDLPADSNPAEDLKVENPAGHEESTEEAVVSDKEESDQRKGFKPSGSLADLRKNSQHFKQVVTVWKKMKEMKCSQVAELRSYMVQYSQESVLHSSSLTGLEAAIQQMKLKKAFWNRILPNMLDRGCELHEHFPQGVMPIMRFGRKDKIILPRCGVASKIAATFLCGLGDSEHSFAAVLCSQQEYQITKLKSYLQYFDALSHLSHDEPKGNMALVKSVSSPFDWLAAPQHLNHFEIVVGNHQDYPGSLQLQASHYEVGGALLYRGRGIEDLQYCTYPEMMAAMFCCYKLETSEALVIRGLERYSTISLSQVSLVYQGGHEDKTSLLENGVVDSNILLADPIKYSYNSEMQDQLTKDNMICDLNKLLTGFTALDDQDRKPSHIAFPHWGCDEAFNGFKEIRALLVWMAASVADCTLSMCLTEKEAAQPMVRKLKKLIQEADDHGISVRELFHACCEVRAVRPTAENFFLHLRNELGLGKQVYGSMQNSEQVESDGDEFSDDGDDEENEENTDEHQERNSKM